MKLKLRVTAEERVFYDFVTVLNVPEDMHGDDMEELIEELCLDRLYKEAPHAAERVAFNITESK